MRKETQRIAAAFKAGTPLREARTKTDGQNVHLHGNLIASRLSDGCYMLTLAGYGTMTTRERLNGISSILSLGVGVCQRDGEQYLATGVEDIPISEDDRVVVDPQSERLRVVPKGEAI